MIRFTPLKEEHLSTVMAWRAQPEVARYMFTDFKPDLEQQRRWFKKISGDDTYRYWVILYQDVPVGVVNLAAIDERNRRCTAGYYIGELDYRSVGAMVPPYLYNHVFRGMGFNKIYGEVLGGNEQILKIHHQHGFREVGVYRDHVWKDGAFHDVILIELLADVWLKQKRYQGYTAEFN